MWYVSIAKNRVRLRYHGIIHPYVLWFYMVDNKTEMWYIGIDGIRKKLTDEVLKHLSTEAYTMSFTDINNYGVIRDSDLIKEFWV